MEILQQLGVDQSFFIQFGLFIAVFFLLEKIYFKPFLKLFDARKKRTVEDRRAAEEMLAQAEQKFSEYQTRLNQARAEARKEFDKAVDQGKQEEQRLMSDAREQAKQISQQAAAETLKLKEQLEKQLASDVEVFAENVKNKLLVK